MNFQMNMINIQIKMMNIQMNMMNIQMNMVNNHMNMQMNIMRCLLLISIFSICRLYVAHFLIKSILLLYIESVNLYFQNGDKCKYFNVSNKQSKGCSIWVETFNGTVYSIIYIYVYMFHWIAKAILHWSISYRCQKLIYIELALLLNETWKYPASIYWYI